MTAQAPDKLVNQHPRVKLEGLHLFDVVRGDPRDWRTVRGPAFCAQPRRPADVAVCSALWRGYVATFVLQPDGRLRLTAFAFPTKHPERQAQEVDELLVGDFWMVMKPEFFGRRTSLPFRDGVVVEHREEWFLEEPFEART